MKKEKESWVLTYHWLIDLFLFICLSAAFYFLGKAVEDQRIERKIQVEHSRLRSDPNDSLE